MGRAYGNIGNAYSAMGYYEQAIKYHKQELTISKEVLSFPLFFRSLSSNLLPYPIFPPSYCHSSTDGSLLFHFRARL